MKYIMKDKTVYPCHCGAICQPLSGDVREGNAFSMKTGQVEKFNYITCPSCRSTITVDAVDMDVPSNIESGIVATPINGSGGLLR